MAMTRLNRMLMQLSNLYFGLAAISAVTSVLPFVKIILDYGWQVFRIAHPYEWWLVIMLFFPFLFLTACSLMSGFGIRKFIEFADDLEAVRRKIEAEHAIVNSKPLPIMSRLDRLLSLVSNIFMLLAAASAIAALLPFLVPLVSRGWGGLMRSVNRDLLTMMMSFFSSLFLMAFSLLSALGIRRFLGVSDDLKAVRAKLESKGGCDG